MLPRQLHLNNMESKPQTRLEKEAEEYLKKHKIVELFHNMMALLVFDRPEQPKLFLANYLDELNMSKISKTDGPCLMDESNINSLFFLLDPTSKGYISLSQYQQAMKTLGIKHYEAIPVGSEINQINFEVFKQHVEQGLAETWATFLE